MLGQGTAHRRSLPRSTNKSYRNPYRFLGQLQQLIGSVHARPIEILLSLEHIESLPTFSMNTDLSGCSKCRFSKRGCKRCRDPDFQARQLIRTAQLERHAAEKNHEVALKVSTHRREKLEDQSTRTRRAKKRTRQAEADAEAFQQELPNRGRDSIAAADPCATVRRQDPHEQADLVQKSRVQQSAKAHISSGLELGLTAGLLPLTGDSSEATQGLQNATLHQHGGHLPGQPSAELLSHAALTSSSDISCSSTQVATGAAVEVSRGGEAETSGMKERPEEQEARQRRFLGLLQSKMQQKQEERQQQGGARVERSLAAALALGARHRKVRSSPCDPPPEITGASSTM